MCDCDCDCRPSVCAGSGAENCCSNDSDTNRKQWLGWIYWGSEQRTCFVSFLPLFGYREVPLCRRRTITLSLYMYVCMYAYTNTHMNTVSGPAYPLVQIANYVYVVSKHIYSCHTSHNRAVLCLPDAAGSTNQ
jgi:hypothetical protein